MNGWKKLFTIAVSTIVLYSVVLGPISIETQGASIPNDRYWGDQWGFRQIGVDRAWDLLWDYWDLGGGHEPSNVGSDDIIVAVLSTGVDFCPDIQQWNNTDEYRIEDPPGNRKFWTCRDWPDDDGLPGKPNFDDDGDVLKDIWDPEVAKADWDEDGVTVEDGDMSDINEAAFDNDENGYTGDLWGWDFVVDVSGGGSGNDDKHGHYCKDYKTIPHCDCVVQGIDRVSYGMRIATIIAAMYGSDDGSPNHPYLGFAGICPAKIMSLRVIKENSYRIQSQAAEERCVKAMDYAIDNGADIIILDIAEPAYKNFLDSKIDEAYSKDIVMVAPVGDLEYDDNIKSFFYREGETGIQYPAIHSKVLGVGSTEYSLGDNPPVARYSKHGTGIDVVAPGGYGFDNNNQLPWNNTKTLGADGDFNHLYFGTTDSAAYVAGLCALLLSYRPSLTAGQVMQIIKATARDLIDESAEEEYDYGYDEYSGWGEIQAYDALCMANYYRGDWSQYRFLAASPFCGGEYYQPDIAVDGSGKSHVVWIETGPVSGKPEIVYGILDTNGKLISGPMYIEDVFCRQSETRYPTICVDNQDYVHVGWIDHPDGWGDLIRYARFTSDGICLDPPELVNDWATLPQIRDLNIGATMLINPHLIPPGPGPIMVYSIKFFDFEIGISTKTDIWINPPQVKWEYFTLFQFPGDQIKVSAEISWSQKFSSDVISVVFQTDNIAPGNWNIGLIQNLYPSLEPITMLGIAATDDQEINPHIDVINYWSPLTDPLCHITWVRYAQGGVARIEYCQIDGNGDATSYGNDNSGGIVCVPLVVSTEFSAVQNVEEYMYPKVSASKIGAYEDELQVDITWAGWDNTNQWWGVYYTELSRDGRTCTENTQIHMGQGYYPAIDCAKEKDFPEFENTYDIDGNYRMVFFEHYGGPPQNLWYQSTHERFDTYVPSFNNPNLLRRKPIITTDEDHGLHVAYESIEDSGGTSYNVIRYAYWQSNARPPSSGPKWDVRISPGNHDCYNPKIVTFKDPDLLDNPICAVIVYFDEDLGGFPRGELVFLKINTEVQSEDDLVIHESALGFTSWNDDEEKNHDIAYDSYHNYVHVVYQITTEDRGEDIYHGVVDHDNNPIFGPDNDIVVVDSQDVENETNPDIDVDDVGNLVIVYEENNTIQYQEAIRGIDAVTKEIIYPRAYSFGINVSPPIEDWIVDFPKISVDRPIHRVEGNNYKSDQLHRIWKYVHIVYSYQDTVLYPKWHLVYAKVRFHEPHHQIYGQNDVYLHSKFVRDFDTRGALKNYLEVVPSSLQMALNSENQVCLAYLVDFGLETVYDPYFAKLDNNGYTITSGQRIKHATEVYSIAMLAGYLDKIEVMMSVPDDLPIMESLVYSRAM